MYKNVDHTIMSCVHLPCLFMIGKTTLNQSLNHYKERLTKQCFLLAPKRYFFFFFKKLEQADQGFLLGQAGVVMSWDVCPFTMNPEDT